MSGSRPRGVEIAAPAKLNLGLEVLGRRDDGYHDIATIFLAIDLCDSLRLSPAAGLELCCDDTVLVGQDNLALRAVHLLRETSGPGQGAHIELVKRIPLASGLGGASSDAAAALLAGRQFWNLPVSDASLTEIAAKLGSDVPFFLQGGCALGRGRGERLEALSVPANLSLVVVTPETSIPRKTATLYANLTPGDFSTGAQVLAQARRIALGLPLDPALLGNAFAQPLYGLAPQLSALPALMRAAGADAVAVSGAGPAHYAPFTERSRAESVADRLRRELRDSAKVFVARPAAERPSPA